MGYLAVLVFLISVGLLIHRKKLATSRVFLWVAVWVGPAFFILEGFDAGEGLLSRSGRYTIRVFIRSPPSLGVMLLPGPARLEWRGTC